MSVPPRGKRSVSKGKKSVEDLLGTGAVQGVSGRRPLIESAPRGLASSDFAFPPSRLASSEPRKGSLRPADLVPKRRDSSIGATSANPRVRRMSYIEKAATLTGPNRHVVPIDFNAPDIQAAMKTLRALFLPVVMRRVKRRRRLATWRGTYPPRTYSAESVVAAIRGSKSPLASWPLDLLQRLAAEEEFHYYKKGEPIIYAGESHLSSGLLVLLHGQISEERKQKVPVSSSSLSHPATGAEPTPKGGTRPVHAQKKRARYAPDVLCADAILCEDTVANAARAVDNPDVAVISSRWLWQCLNDYLVQSPLSEHLLESCRGALLPMREEMVRQKYYATSAVLQRSWMWPFLSSSDRVKLARAMDVKVVGFGDVLYEEGRDNPYIYVVRRGTLTVVVKGEPLLVVQPGMAFGEVSAIFGDPRNSSVVAGSFCELYALHRDDLHRRFSKYPDLARLITLKALERRHDWLEEGKRRDIFGLVSLLAGVPCLSHTSEAAREELSACAETHTLPSGHVLATAESPCDALYVVGRGVVRIGGAKDPTRPYQSLPSNGEARSTGDYFGELCLRPHLWPSDIVTETSVDLWVLPMGEVRRILEQANALAQAEEVCRHGIDLYRARKGSQSIIEGFSMESPMTPVRRGSAALSLRRGSTLSKTSSPAPADSHRPASTGANGEPAAPPLPLGDFNWLNYVEESHKRVSSLTSATATLHPHRDLREVDKETEKSLSAKVLDLISLPPANLPNPADSDFPSDISDLQAIIVEQLLLTPSAKQPRFLHQVNRSNVQLITGDEEEESPDPLIVPDGGEVGMLESLAQDECAVPIGGIQELHSGSDMADGTARSNNTSFDQAEAQSSVPEYVYSADVLNFDGSSGGLVNFSSSFGRLATSPVATGRGRPSSVHAAMEMESTSFGVGANRRLSISRGNMARPPSGIPLSPRATSSAGGLPVSPSAANLACSRPVSSTADQIALAGASSGRVRPASVDYNHQGKVNSERPTTALDRYVKIADQDYFGTFVKVLPLQQEEILEGSLVSGNLDGDNSGGGPLILMLLHVRKCEHLPAAEMEALARPLVKVSLGKRVLIRTPPMKNRNKPRWPVEQSSFVTFVRRGVQLRFALCDGSEGGNDRELYFCLLSTDQLHENDGVGQMTLKLKRSEDDPSNATAPVAGKKPPKVVVTLLAVTASKYRALDQRLRNSTTSVPDSHVSESDDNNTIFFQTMAVRGLKHRIEASLKVYLHSGHDEQPQLILETPRALPKTRSPAWPASVSYARVHSDGFLSFELYHRDVLIGTHEVGVDELVFGGMGIRQCPLVQAQSGAETIGNLMLNVLGAVTCTENQDRQRRKAFFLHIEGFRILNADSYIIPPDPLVVLRDANGTIVLQTQLAYGAFEETFDIADASCFLQCPALAGSSTTYHLDLCDNDAHTKIGSAELHVTPDGLGPANRYDVPMSSNGDAVVRISMKQFPVQNLMHSKKMQDGKHTPYFTRDDPLLLVHIQRCENLPGSDSGVFRVDAVARLLFGREEFLRTPSADGTTNPQWSRNKASVVLRVRPDEADFGVLQVFDGIVDAADLIGEVSMPLVELCRTGEHTYTLFADTAAGYQNAREVGTIHVRTFCGTIDRAIMKPGVSPFFDPSDGIPTSHAIGYYDSISQSNASSAGLLAGGTVDYAPQVRLSLTNICSVLSRVAVKDVVVTVSLAGEVLLQTLIRVNGDNGFWDIDGACVVLRRTQMHQKTLRVRAVATEVRPAVGEANAELASQSLISNGAAAPMPLSATQRGPVQQPLPEVVLGIALIEFDDIANVAVNEAKAYDCTLKTRDELHGATPPPRDLSRPPTPRQVMSARPPPSPANKVEAGGPPTVLSFCVAGVDLAKPVGRPSVIVQ